MRTAASKAIGHRTARPASAPRLPMTPETHMGITPGTPTLVLGMHRSGASLAARLLRDAGWFLGEEVDLVAPASDNQDGYLERIDVRLLHERLLGELGFSWDRPPPIEVIRALQGVGSSRLRKTCAHIVDQAAGQPFAVKDPRLCLLLSWWQPLLPPDTCFVFVVRNPLEVARSLLERDGMPFHHGLALWEWYTSSALDQLHGYPVTIVSYGGMVADPGLAASFLESVLVKRGAADAHDADRLATTARVAVAPHLQRQRASNEELATFATVHQREIWDWLQSLPLAVARLDVPQHIRRPSTGAVWTVLASGPRRGISRGS